MRRQWRPSLPLRWRVFALLTVLAGLLILDAVLGTTYNSRLEAQQQEVSRLVPAEEVPERLIAALVDQQNSVRGYALTRDERLLDTYVRQQSAEGRGLRMLRRRLAGQPDLLAHVDGVAEGITRWHRRVAEPVIGATQAGNTARAVRLVITLDERLFGEVRRDSAALSRAIDEQLDASTLAAQQAGRDLDRELLVSSVVGLCFLVACAVLIRRWITRPVTNLSYQVRQVAGGRLDRRIAGAGPSEFKRLGGDVEVMRRRIRDELEETRRAVEALQQNAPLVMSLRSQLVGSPVRLPDGLRMAARFEPAEGVLAGDWIEAIRIDQDRVGVIVVDVSGHGPEAGLRALWLKHLLVPALNLELEPADALHWVVGQIGDTGDWFATCVILELDAATGKCLYANAGHPPALVVGARGIRELDPTGPLFTDLPGARWDTAQTTLRDDEMLVVYTDGITEARNATGEEYGDERLAAVLASARGLDLEAVADRVMDGVHAFGRGRLADDVTLVVAARQRVRSDAAPSEVRITGRRRALQPDP